MFKKMSDVHECCDTMFAWMWNDKSSREMKMKGKVAQNSKAVQETKGDSRS